MQPCLLQGFCSWAVLLWMSRPLPAVREMLLLLLGDKVLLREPEKNQLISGLQTTERSPTHCCD